MSSRYEHDRPVGPNELRARFDARVRDLVAAQDAEREAGGARGLARARYLRGSRLTLASDTEPLPSGDRSLRAKLLSFARWAALPAVAVAGVVLWRALTPQALRYQVGADGDGREGAEYVASTRPLPLRFSDGSEVDLDEGPAGEGALRVAELYRDGARMALERGRAKVRVVHSDRTRWLFSAGPYEVRVIGTRFDLAWDPSAERLSLTLIEGRVQVSGGRLAEPTLVAAGQSLQADRSSVALEPERAEVVEPPEPVSPAPPQAEPSPSALAVATVEKAGAPTALAAGAPMAAAASERGRRQGPPERAFGTKAESQIWIDLAAAGKYGDALAAAEQAGFDGICRQATASDLLTLAETGRFAKNPARARQALGALRSRFPNAPQALASTFLLGRLALESRDYAEAERRFRNYLADSPGGPLAPEAHGRLLETLDASGQHDRARGEATRYLEQFPNGSYATLAKKILAR